MTTKTTATFELKGWDEKALEDDESLPKVTRATVTKEFSGDGEMTLAVRFS